MKSLGLLHDVFVTVSSCCNTFCYWTPCSSPALYTCPSFQALSCSDTRTWWSSLSRATTWKYNEDDSKSENDSKYTQNGNTHSNEILNPAILCLIRPKSYFFQTAGCEFSQASNDIPHDGICDSAVSALSWNLWCMDSRQMEVHTSGCQECQVAAMWLCIFAAALRRAHAL